MCVCVCMHALLLSCFCSDDDINCTNSHAPPPPQLLLDQVLSRMLARIPTMDPRVVNVLAGGSSSPSAQAVAAGAAGPSSSLSAGSASTMPARFKNATHKLVAQRRHQRHDSGRSTSSEGNKDKDHDSNESMSGSMPSDTLAASLQAPNPMVLVSSVPSSPGVPPDGTDRTPPHLPGQALYSADEQEKLD